MEHLKKRWWFRAVRIALWVIAAIVFIFLNAPDIQRGVEEYKKGGEGRLVTQVSISVKDGMVERYNATVSLVKEVLQ